MKLVIFGKIDKRYPRCTLTQFTTISKIRSVAAENAPWIAGPIFLQFLRWQESLLPQHTNSGASVNSAYLDKILYHCNDSCYFYTLLCNFVTTQNYLVNWVFILTAAACNAASICSVAPIEEEGVVTPSPLHTTPTRPQRCLFLRQKFQDE